MRTRLTSLSFIVLVLCLSKGKAASTVEPGFTSLFDGKNIEEHFVIKGRKESWTVKDGVIHSLRGGDRIMSKKTYGDFVLRLDWRVSKEGNSGVFIRVPGQEDSAPWVSGFEVQISNAHRDDAHCTASLYGVQKTEPRPTKEAEAANVWHTYEITCLGDHITVRLDGVVNVNAHTRTNPEAAKRPMSGYIGLQDYHAAQGIVEYRNIRVQELQPNGVPKGFDALSLDDKGWHEIKTGHGSGGRLRRTGRR